MNKDEIKKRKPGRPPSDKPINDRAHNYTVSCTPNDHKDIIAVHGGLSEALKYVAKLCRLSKKPKK